MVDRDLSWVWPVIGISGGILLFIIGILLAQNATQDTMWLPAILLIAGITLFILPFAVEVNFSKKDTMTYFALKNLGRKK